MSSKSSPSDPFYISLAVVLEIHQRQLKEFGGADGIRNYPGLVAALDVALTFLAINGFEITDEKIELYDAMIAIAEKKMTKEQLADLFERLVAK
jgi:prophage maintenance system killer protein